MKDWNGQISNCCGAPIVMHDICSACLEHCEPEEEDAELSAEDFAEQRGEWMMECERNGD